MDLDFLHRFDLVYMATVYTKHPAGLERAFVDACELAGELIRKGVNVYSPIAHTHPIAKHANMDPLDHDMWLAFDEAMMDASDALVVMTMPGWQASKGIAHEIRRFQANNKPIYYLDPDTVMGYMVEAAGG